MIRFVMALAGLLASVPAWAVGFGAPLVQSAIGEPLRLTIPLVGTEPEKAYSVHVASSEEFARLGLSRPAWIGQLQVSLDHDPTPQVNLRTSAPVREPLVVLALDLTWQGGRLLREVTLLLDPPGLGGRIKRTPAALSPAAAARKAGASHAGTYGPVRENETLWAIAERTRPEGVSVPTMMAALQRSNPKAFVDGDPNRLLAGQTLDIPISVADSREPAPERIEPREEAARTRAAAGGLQVLSPDDAVEDARANGEAGLDDLRAQLHIMRSEAATRREQNQAILSRLSTLEARSTLLVNELKAKEAKAQALREQLARKQSARPVEQAQTEVAPSGVQQPVDTANVAKPRVDSWRGWLLVGSVVTLGLLISGVMLWVKMRQTKMGELTQQLVFGKRGRAAHAAAAGGSSNYAPSVFAETSAALDGVLAEEPAEGDPLMEVALLKNFGRYDQAETLLRELIGQYPRRDEYRLELLDVHFQTQNSKAFLAFATALAPSLRRRSPKRWAEVARMGAILCPGHALFTAAEDSAPMSDQSARVTPQYMEPGNAPQPSATDAPASFDVSSAMRGEDVSSSEDDARSNASEEESFAHPLPKAAGH